MVQEAAGQTAEIIAMIFSEAPLLKTGPTVKRGQSKQDYETPEDFMDAVIHRFGSISFDLAASVDNTKAYHYFTEEQDSLKQSWHELGGLLWLNCPFNNITPWARKCAEEAARGAKILFLTPASVGANWFADYVHRKALVLALNPRLCFDGKNPYPKDCVLSVYNLEHGFDVWRWKQ